jgi:DNA invertase Pin-like site-specific DNA recombinase
VQILQQITETHSPADLRPIGYARVSTQDQDLGMQLAELTKNGVPPENIYRETISGAKERRPEFERMMRELRPGDVVTVWKLDRLSRSLPAMLETVEEIHRRGAKLRVITQQIDTSTASGRLFLNMLGVIAEFERDLGVERTVAGLERARSEGRVGGRKPLYSDEQIREAIEALDRGVSWLRAAKLVVTDGKQISLANLKKRVREMRAKETGNA